MNPITEFLASSDHPFGAKRGWLHDDWTAGTGPSAERLGFLCLAEILTRYEFHILQVCSGHPPSSMHNWTATRMLRLRRPFRYRKRLADEWNRVNASSGPRANCIYRHQPTREDTPDLIRQLEVMR